jgi:hypothetical protein
MLFNCACNTLKSPQFGKVREAEIQIVWNFKETPKNESQEIIINTEIISYYTTKAIGYNDNFQ